MLERSSKTHKAFFAFVAVNTFKPACIHFEKVGLPVFVFDDFGSSPVETNNKRSAFKPNFAQASVDVNNKVLPTFASKSPCSIALVMAPWVAILRAARGPVNFLGFLIAKPSNAKTKHAVA